MADREFVGQRWVNFLKKHEIPYYVRIKKSISVEVKQGNSIRASLLFNPLKIGEKAWRDKSVTVQGVECYLTACKLKNREGKAELQLIISYDQLSDPLQQYARRWQIETMFKALKTSGFNLERTHITRSERIERLLALVIIAYTWAYKVGIYLHGAVKKIPIKKHGRRAKSFVKYGLEYIAEKLFNALQKTTPINVFAFLSGT